MAGEELARVEGELTREAREDAELRQQYGRAWQRPASAALNSTLLEKVAGTRPRCPGHPLPFPLVSFCMFGSPKNSLGYQ